MPTTAKQTHPYEERAIERLREKGYRITMPRIQVIRALAWANEKPLSAYGIYDAITAANGKIDVVSVYRILETLVEVGLIVKVSALGEGYICSNPKANPDLTIIHVAEDDGTAYQSHKCPIEVLHHLRGKRVHIEVLE